MRIDHIDILGFKKTLELYLDTKWIEELTGLQDPKTKEFKVKFISEPVKSPLELVPQGKALCYIKTSDRVVLELSEYGLKNYEISK